jgi:hypothetical protein
MFKEFWAADQSPFRTRRQRGQGALSGEKRIVQGAEAGLGAVSLTRVFAKRVMPAPTTQGD